MKSIIYVFKDISKFVNKQCNILLIDNIEAGIHHSQMLSIIHNIIEYLSSNKVKLIATTHSYEWIRNMFEYLNSDGYKFKKCIKTANEILKEEDNAVFISDLKVIRLERLKENDEIKERDNLKIVEYSYKKFGWIRC